MVTKLLASVVCWFAASNLVAERNIDWEIPPSNGIVQAEYAYEGIGHYGTPWGFGDFEAVIQMQDLPPVGILAGMHEISKILTIRTLQPSSAKGWTLLKRIDVPWIAFGDVEILETSDNSQHMRRIAPVPGTTNRLRVRVGDKDLHFRLEFLGSRPHSITFEED